MTVILAWLETLPPELAVSQETSVEVVKENVPPPCNERLTDCELGGSPWFAEKLSEVGDSVYVGGADPETASMTLTVPPGEIKT